MTLLKTSFQVTGNNIKLILKTTNMSNIGKIIRVNVLPPVGERENNVIYQVAAPGAANYTDYAVDKNGDIKVQAGYINPQDLIDSAISISTQEFLDEGIDTQEEFNTNTRERLVQKLDKPYMDGTTQEYPKVLGLDNNGNTATLPAGDLGKNIANSSLTSVAGSGLDLGADWAVNTSGHQYSISGLSDVSTNPSFDTFLSQDDSGKIGKTNGIQPFLSLPSVLSESEKTVWKTAMNGGWTTNTMSVAIVSPPVISTDDKPTWISLKGANLNFNPASFSVKIVDDTGATVLAEVPNSQVQLYTNGLDLTFWFNFKDLALGNCKIKLWNGVVEYLIPQTILITAVLDLIPLGSLSWEVKEFTPGTGTILAAGNGLNYQPSAVNKPYAIDSTIVVAAKSGEICAVNQNFYIRGIFSFTGGPSSYYDIFTGVMNNSTPLELVNSIVAYIKGSARAGSTDAYKTTYTDNGSGSSSGAETQLCEFIIQRNQGLFTIILNINGLVIVHTKTGSTEAMALGFFVTNNPLSTSTSYLTITEGYKF